MSQNVAERSRLFVYGTSGTAGAAGGLAAQPGGPKGTERSRPSPAPIAAGSGPGRAGRGLDTETSPGAARPRCSTGTTRWAGPEHRGASPEHRRASPEHRGVTAPTRARPRRCLPSPARLPSHARPAPLPSSSTPRPARPSPAPKSFQVREARVYRGRAGLVRPAVRWALAALGPAALSCPAEEMGSSGASPPGPAALPGTARRAAPAPAPCRRRPPAGEGRDGAGPERVRPSDPGQGWNGADPTL